MQPRFVARLAALVTAVSVTAASTPVHAQLPPPPRDGTVKVRLDGNRAYLEQDAADIDWHTDWTKICASPCETSVPLHALYRVDGPGIRPSAPFTLQGTNGDAVDVHVSATNSTSYYLGAATTALGATATTVGVGGWYVSALDDSLARNFDPNRNTQAPWIATTAIGVVALTSGVVLLLLNRRSHTSQNVHR